MISEGTKKTVLAVDDDAAELSKLKGTLGGLYDLRLCRTASSALSMLGRTKIDIILLDVDMPGLNGYEFLKAIKKNPLTSEIPVIFLTGRSDDASELEGLTIGAVDYLSKPVAPSLIIKHIEIHLLIESQKRKLKDFNDNLQAMVNLKTEKVIRLQNAILSTVANLVEYRDLSTGSHIGRTERYFEILVLAVMNDEKYKKISEGWDVSLLLQSSLLHDVGKIAIKDDILLKPGRLDEMEFSEMKKHVYYGLEIIEKMAKFYDEDNFMDYARIVVGYHHEKWDGSGYLKGLSGTEIPLLGRVMSIADVYDAITSERPYKKAMPHEKAMEIILNGRGSHFDPLLVDIFEENAGAFKNVNMLGKA